MKRRTFSAERHVPKYRQVLEDLAQDILSGKYQPGQKVPSEAALVQQFQTSRITIGRALRELVHRGLVERVAGSGTFVRGAAVTEKGMLFGLLIMNLGNTEVFEPICRGIAATPQAAQHALLWGSAAASEVLAEAQALQLCDQFIQRKVSGVFFAPVEMTPKAQQTNLEILSRLEAARIPIILLDRCVMPYPQRCAHDLVGIDNRRAGYIATEHLLHLGSRRLAFVAYSGGAPTIEARLAGFRGAILANGLQLERGQVYRFDAITESTVNSILEKKNLEAFVCANDRTAGHLMRVLLALGHRIPKDARIVGIDDVEYASLLPVPLTTVRQPCREIGEAAMAAMIDRIARPDMPVRDILVECHLVVRQSCGARSA